MSTFGDDMFGGRVGRGRRATQQRAQPVRGNVAFQAAAQGVEAAEIDPVTAAPEPGPAAVHAEAAGFDAAMCSDHWAPWSEQQGQSGFAWSWLGAALEVARAAT